MNCWHFDSRIFAACRDVPRSVAGRIRAARSGRPGDPPGRAVQGARARGAVLDLSRRADAAEVERRLAGHRSRRHDRRRSRRRSGRLRTGSAEAAGQARALRLVLGAFEATRPFDGSRANMFRGSPAGWRCSASTPTTPAAAAWCAPSPAGWCWRRLPAGDGAHQAAAAGVVGVLAEDLQPAGYPEQQIEPAASSNGRVPKTPRAPGRRARAWPAPPRNPDHSLPDPSARSSPLMAPDGPASRRSRLRPRRRGGNPVRRRVRGAPEPHAPADRRPTASGSSNSPRTERGTSRHAAKMREIEMPAVHAQ